MSPEDKFRTTLEIRNMEIHLYWERSNFFLALNTAIAVGFFALDNKTLTIPLACLGLISSFFWLLVNMGSKFWQSRWEEKLRDVEAEVLPDLNLFTESREEIRLSVERHLRRYSRTIFDRLLIPGILLKPSVSSLVIHLSFLFCVLWALMVFLFAFGS